MNSPDPLVDRLRAYGQVLDDSRAVTADQHIPRRLAMRALAGVACVAVVAGSSVILRERTRDYRLETATSGSTIPPVPPNTDTVFPVVGDTSYVDTFGAPRLTGTVDAHVQQGTDIFAPRRAVVRAMRGGVVSGLGQARLGGNRLWVTDADGHLYYYALLDSFRVGLRNGDTVAIGETLGFVGSEGTAPAHIHLEIHVRLRDGKSTVARNPFPLLQVLERTEAPRGEIVNVEGILVRRDVSEPLRSLMQEAKAAGFAFSGSGYRSTAGQIAIRRRNCGTSPFDVYVVPASSCRPPTAIPGRSPHEQGTAIDFTFKGRAVRKDSPAHRWLIANAERFGFVGIDAEPWHWEYSPK